MRLSLGFTLILILCVAACGNNGNNDNNSVDAGATDALSVTCAPTSSCVAVNKTCLGLVDNTGLTQFGLRMSEIDVAHPLALSSGAVATLVKNSVETNLTACNLDGTGNFSWLLQFDTGAGTIKTGGAKPAADPTAGYAFDSETLSGFAVAPVVMSATPDGSGNFAVATGVDLNLPIFLNAAGTSSVLIPLHMMRFSMGTLSSSNSCIGSYNATGLDPANGCQPTSTVSPFLTAGTFDGFISLEDADQVSIVSISESLCVFLAGSTYSDGASPVAHCKRDGSNVITFAGDWCAATNSAAGAGCADALRWNGSFAASSIEITN